MATNNSFNNTITDGLGSIALQPDAAASTVTIGGTGQTGTITLGSSSGTNTLVIAGGAGATAVNIANAQNGGSVAVGAAMTSGTIALGGAQTSGTITIGGGVQTGTITLGGGTGAQTVNLATGGTGIKTVHIADSAIDNVVTIGSTTGTASLTLQSGSGNIAMNTGLTVSSTGVMTNTKQPAFFAYLSANVSNVTGDGTAYTIAFNSTKVNQGTNFSTSTHLFTAPVTGLYFLGVSFIVTGLLVGHTVTQTYFNGAGTTATTQAGAYQNSYPISISGEYAYSYSTLMYMTATDTVGIILIVNGSTKVIGINGTYGGAAFYGNLVC